MVPYYQSGRGMASLIDTNQKELSAMLNKSVNTNQNTTGKTM